MTDGEIAKFIVDAMTAAADKEAGGKTGLVSVVVERLAALEPDRLEVRLERKTKTLVFLKAQYLSDGALTAIAASVHKVVE